MKILLTGGAGYIGSHTAVMLIQAGHEVVLLDNFYNSDPSVLKRLAKIVGNPVHCIEADVRDTNLIEKVLREYQVDAVIHFAGLKAVGESSHKPIEYYSNNVQGSISLLQAMTRCNIKRLIFSSSATVYGDPQYLPLDELHPTNPTSPYGRNKLQIEELLRDVSNSDPEWSVCALRYFNPVGAHESGLIGEDPKGIPNNLMPYVAQVASGKLPVLKVFGDDYDTEDGTGVRDYIHVMDLASGHLAALVYLSNYKGFNVFNLGTGNGISVFEIVRAYENVCGHTLNIQVTHRRIGDIAKCYASSGKALKELSWVASRDVNNMCCDLFRWQKNLLMQT